MINFKIGILGAGNISEKIAATLNSLDSFEPYAIAARDIDRANAFGDKYNITKRYGSYEELVNDPDVELVYIATPNSLHAEHAELALNAGKPVLVEKPFSYDAKTTARVLSLAKEKNLFAAEAMWIRCLPMYERMIYNINEGMIGKVYNITCSLGYKVFNKERIKDLSLGGGALLDLGVYPLNLIHMVYGMLPATVSSSCVKLETGVDAQASLQLGYKGGVTASAFISVMYDADNGAKIYGDRGYIEVDNINCPEAYRIYQGNHTLVTEVKLPENHISGYEYEFLSARQSIITGKNEMLEYTHEQIIDTMKFLDAARSAWKIKFPME